MATYRMTPYERRARAQKIIQARENRSLYNNYLKEKDSYEKQLEEERLKTVWAERDKNSQSLFVRGLHTVGDLVANVITGAAKGFEGIYDLGAGVVGAVGGIFDNDFQERVKTAIAYDWTGETFGKALQDAFRYSFTNNGGIIENVASGVGQMLPSVAALLLTGGAGAPAAAAQAASLATLGVSAAGTSTEEAFKEGADYWAGLGYGAASGLVEVGTEKLFGGVTKALTGAGILDGITRSIAPTGIKRKVLDVLGEGVEEMISEGVNPALKSIYKGADALKEYEDPDFLKGVGEAGLVGSLTSLVYGETVGRGLSKIGVGYVGKEADISDSLVEINSLNNKASELQGRGELEGINEQKIDATKRKNYENIEKTLKKVKDDTKRAKLIEKFNLGNEFNADGSMKESINTPNDSQSDVASPKKESYSYGLRGNEKTIFSDLDRISEDLANKYVEAEQEKGNNVTIEQAREKVGKIEVSENEMSDTAKEKRNKFIKGLNYLNKKSGANITFVVTKENGSFNGLLLDDRTIYIGEDQFEKGTWAGTLVHEYTHLAEDSKAYAELVKFLISDSLLVNDGKGGKVRLLEKASESVLSKNYGFNTETLNEIQDKILNNQELTAEEKKYYNDFKSEVGAHETEYLLGNEEFIDRIVAKDSSFVEKFLEKIENLRKAFEKVGDKDAEKAKKQLHKAEKLYLKAASQAGNMKLMRFLLSNNPDLKKEIDLSEQIQYNKKAKYLNISKQEYAIISSRIMEDNSRIVARNQELPRYGKARSSNYFYVYENFAIGNFGVLKQIEITDSNREYLASIEERIGGNNGEQTIGSTSELNRLLKVLKTRTRYNYSDNAYDSERRADSKNGGVSFGQSEGERIGNTEKGDGNKRVKYSLKDRKVTSYINKNLDTPTLSYIRTELSKVYGETDNAIADGIAIEKDNTIYIVYSGCEEGRIDFGVRRKITISDRTKRLKYIKNINKESYENGYGSREVFERLGLELDNDSRSDVGRELRQDNGITNGESQNNESRISDKNGNNGRINFSLKDAKDGLNFTKPVLYDSYGNPLSQQQKEYFANSKIRSMKGNLISVWHGTDNQFYTFDKALRGSHTGTPDAKLGFFFSDSYEVAQDYTFSAREYNQFNLMMKIAEGDWNAFERLQDKHYDEFATTEDLERLKEYDENTSSGNTREYFLNITDPYIEDWQNKSYHKLAMIKAIKKAISLKKDGLVILNIEDSINGKTPSNVYVAFEPNQIKLTTNKNPTLNNDIRYSLKENKYAERDPATVTEKEFNHHYWAVANEIITKEEIGVLTSSISKLNKGEFFFKNSDGFYMIPVGEKGIYNKIVFTDGKYDSFSIDTVIEINLDNETDLDDTRRFLYEQARNDIPTENSDLFKVNYSKDFKFNDFKKEVLENKRNSGIERDGRRSNGETKYSLKEDDSSKKYFYELTDGQIKKLLADKTKKKVYSKVESEKVINTIISESLGVDEKFGSLKGKAKSEAIEMLWRGLNTADPGKQMHVALEVADYIIKNSVLENIYEESENSVYVDMISTLRQYFHSIDLSALKDDIKQRYDKDNSSYARWSVGQNGKGLTADQVKAELAERGFYIDTDNEAEIFFRIDSAYTEAKNALEKQSKKLLSAALSSEERKTLKNNIAREVLLAFDENGKQSKFSKILEQYHKEAFTWKEKYYDERKRNTVINRLLDKVQKIKEWKKGTFINASQYKADIFKKSIDKLANIKFRGDLNQSGIRDIVSGVQEWYNKENPILKDSYDSDIAEMLYDIATGEGKKLTTQELINLSNVVDYFKHFVENYNKVSRNGELVEAKPIAEKYVSIMKRNQTVNVGWLKRFFEKYLTTFGDPMTVARYFDKYENGFYSEMMASLRDAAANSQIDEMEIREPIENFIGKNKKYFKEAAKKTVKYQGRDIPLLQAMYVYAAMYDVDTIPSFAKSGFKYNDGDLDIRIDGFAQNEDIDAAEMQAIAKEIQSSLEKQFSSTDLEFIDIAREIFNGVCRKKYVDTSVAIKGYANVKEGEYLPKRMANVAKNVDTTTFEYEVKSASNPSFTKSRVKGAKGELFVEGLDTVLDRHIRAVAQYANLAPTLEAYNRLFNLNTVENNNKPVSVATESNNVWSQGNEYFKKLINDIKGVPAAKGDGVKFMAFLRSGYAKFQLGANFKVWVTQLSSFFASGSILDYSSILKGIGINTNDVDNYCKLAKLRNNDNVAAMAQGVLETVNEFGNVLMKPIGAVDRFVIKKLFGACQVQVEKDFGLKLGTEENKVKAGELLKRVILETQQNSMATERSSAMRSGSEFMKTITMFSADSMKVIGRVVDSLGELYSLKAKRKILTDAKGIASIDSQIKQATKKVAKSTTSLITSAVFMALVAQLFRTLYNKDDEDDNVVANMTTDAIGNLFGGLPIFKDIYSRFIDGYDIDGYAYSAINDMFDSADNIFKMCGGIVTGEVTSQEVAKNIKNMVYAAGQIFGLPTRNVYNVAYGLTKRVSPSAAYKIDTAFYNKKYSTDLKKAIENEDDDMIATIVELMTNERVGNIGDSTVSAELNSLVTKGYDVIPRSVGQTLTYDGEEINLTNNQRKRFKEVYSVANKAVASLVKLTQYESASEEVKAKAIKYIYSVYHNLALQDLLGVDLETKTVLFAEAIDVEKLAIIVATANSLTADLDNKGKAISGTRKRKIQSYVNSLRLSAAQKYMIMGYLGFRNLKGETQVKAYINRLNLTKSEKSKLLKYSGYEE